MAEIEAEEGAGDEDGVVFVAPQTNPSTPTIKATKHTIAKPKVDTTVVVGDQPPNTAPADSPIHQRLASVGRHWWRERAARPYVGHLIGRGLRLPFGRKGTPPAVVPQPRQYDQDLVELVEDMRKKGAIEQVDRASLRSGFPVFTVPKKGVAPGETRPTKRSRLISDIRKLNSYLRTPPHRKMEGMADLVRVLGDYAYGGVLDVEDAYLHCPIAQEHRKFLGFGIREANGATSWYRCAALPFGLSWSPETWQAVFGEVIAKVRDLCPDCLLLVHLDDVLVLGKTRAAAQRCLDTLRRQVTAAGLAINQRKTMAKVRTSLEWCGFVADFKRATIRVPHDKLKGVISDLRRAQSAASEGVPMTARRMAAVLGKFRALAPAVTCVRAFSRRLTNHLARAIRRVGWDTPLQWPPQVAQELKSCLSCVKVFKNSCRAAGPDTPVMNLASDASLRRWGGSKLSCPPTANDLERNRPKVIEETGGPFKGAMTPLHITAKELKAAELTLRCYAIPRSVVNLWVDATTVVGVLRRWGSKSAALNHIVKRIFRFCWRRKILLNTFYLPGEVNPADDPSRAWEKEDYKVQQWAWRLILRDLGVQPEVDLFATSTNRQCPCFMGRQRQPGSIATNALRTHWGSLSAQCMWANPPWSLLRELNPKVGELRRGQQLVLLVPTWRHAPWAECLWRKSTATLTLPHRSLYEDQMGKAMPRPKWSSTALLFEGA